MVSSSIELTITERQRVINALVTTADFLNEQCHNESLSDERRALDASLANDYRALARRFFPSGAVEHVLEQVAALKEEEAK